MSDLTKIAELYRAMVVAVEKADLAEIAAEQSRSAVRYMALIVNQMWEAERIHAALAEPSGE